MSGYGYIPEDMFCRPDVKPGDFAVYAALEAHCTTERRHCWPGQDTLMRMTGLGVRALRDALGRLTLARFIRVERKSVGGLKRGNVYHLRPARIAPSEDVTPEGKTGTDRTIDRHGSHHHTGTDRTVYSGADRTVEVSQREASHPKNTPPSPSAPAPGGGELDLGDQTQATKGKTSRFAPPQPSEVQEYFRERGCHQIEEAHNFVDFYGSKGWLVGKVKMKDWRAAARGWIRRNRDKPATVRESFHRQPIQAVTEDSGYYRDDGADEMAQQRAEQQRTIAAKRAEWDAMTEDERAGKSKAWRATWLPLIGRA